jgi:hypothetical protein
MKRYAIPLLFLCSGAKAKADTFIAPTIPGSNARDFGSPGYVISRESLVGRTTITPTIVGNRAPDLSAPRVVINGDVAYRTIPGTNARDYSAPGYRLEPSMGRPKADIPRFRVFADE